MHLSRDQLAERYLEQLPYTPYPLQEEAILAWFTSEQGVLVCAPTGTGKTLIAEAALFEALHQGSVAYYTTPLVALTEQKFAEMQAAAQRWGFAAEEVGLVTGNRRVNPQARILVVVAEILLNRLLHSAAFDFSQVSAVVMDEFHSFADPERGIVWEFALGLLPAHVRLLLLSATVGNAREFVAWLGRCHHRKLELVEGTERRVPLAYQWVPDELLADQLVRMARGTPEERLTPALVFAFNREECWTVAEQLKGCNLVQEPERSQLAREVERLDLRRGAGPKLKQLLLRGVGVHHAGVLPKYRRMVEHLFQRKLLAVCMCTETLAAGINLPARSVVLTSLVKGPPGNQKLLDPSTAHQIFGRAGRPQYDTQGYVFALAHEDDVRIARWKEKYDAIPEDTRDPNLIRAKKALKKKRPQRRENQVYWNEAQFEKLRASPPGKLSSKGPLPWRLLAYLLRVSPEVEPILKLVRKRLLEERRLRAGEHALIDMLRLLHNAGYVVLEPPPPAPGTQPDTPPQPHRGLLLPNTPPPADAQPSQPPEAPLYVPKLAAPTPRLERLLLFRSIHPLFGDWLIDLLGQADPHERIQALEAVLEIPGSVLHRVRVPPDVPPGSLAIGYLDAELVARGLMAAPPDTPDEEDADWTEEGVFERPPMLADKLRVLFESLYPELAGIKCQPVWVAGELLEFHGDFDAYVRGRDLVKQEGVIFRHLLRLVLLCGEMAALTPRNADAAEWQEFLNDLARRLTESCRAVDPASTDEAIEQAQASDLLAASREDAPGAVAGGLAR
ncbi:MAG: DEAD/DEAH box helicase [Pirellulales bacterium]|nr:DEAD/DEAH box helicase [Pirellulales bacterium]